MRRAEKERLCFEFLFSDKNGLLRRYSAPSHLSTERMREEITDMACDMADEMPDGMTLAQAEDLFLDVRKLVRIRHGSRSWPTIKTLVTAMRDAAAKRPTASDDNEIEARMIAMLADWFARHKCQMPASGKPSRTRALIDMGVLTSEREAKFYGFDLSTEDERKAREQEPCAAEIEHHNRVAEKLRIWREAREASGR